APSILSADFSRLKEEIRDVEASGCDALHVDVMDGQFVPNLTIGPCVIQSIRKTTKLPLDVHLMIVEPSRYLTDFRDAGSDWITVHIEAIKDVRATLTRIKKMGARAGISLRPRTPASRLYPYLKEIDLILVMTVEPGFGGQSFMEPMIQKVRDLRPKFSGLISVDGGINPQTAQIAKKAGADVLVAGSSIFKAPDRKEIIRQLRNQGK
ncbi:MAG: ribulose-phosphate 3-epimerase, partial [Candidatus Omnitrophica bacterium]|nr:ribulose-phosphate 3-epimerase [Candidatus Omnitrophota bacterium]